MHVFTVWKSRESKSVDQRPRKSKIKKKENFSIHEHNQIFFETKFFLIKYIFLRFTTFSLKTKFLFEYQICLWKPNFSLKTKCFFETTFFLKTKFFFETIFSLGTHVFDNVLFRKKNCFSKKNLVSKKILVFEEQCFYINLQTFNTII